jgi:hypothetical protein
VTVDVAYVKLKQWDQWPERACSSTVRAGDS